MATRKSASSSASSVFTSIEDYIRIKNPDLCQLFDICHLNILTPREGPKYGATLIIPPKAEIARLISDSNSTEVAKISNVCRSLQSLVVRRAIMSPNDWADDTLDSQHPAHRIATKVSGKSVSLMDGAREVALTLNADFRSAFRNLAVWTMADNGTVNPDRGEVVEQQGRARLKKDIKAAAARARTGGYEATAQHGKSARFRVAIAAENEYLAAMVTPRPTSVSVAIAVTGGNPRTAQQMPTNGPSAFLTYIVSFAHYVHEHDANLFFQAVLPLIGFRVIDFYAIFESHRICDDRAKYLIPDEIIDDWFASFKYRPNKCEDIIAFRKWIDERLVEAETACPCALYAHSATDLITEIDVARTNTMSAIQDVTRASQSIVSLYTSMFANNSLSQITNIYLERIANYWQARPCAKLAHDELAFVTEPIFCDLTRAFDIKRYHDVISMIGVIMHAETDREICDKLPLTSARKLAMFANDVLMSELRVFVNSTTFLWIPLTSAVLHDYPVQDSTSRANSDALYNVDLALALHHERLLGPEVERIARENREAALAALRDLRSGNVSAELRSRMQTLISQ